MELRDVISIVGITVGVVAIIFGAGTAFSGINENANSDARTERICVNHSELPDPGESGQVTCNEYETVQYGEESPGNEKIGFGVVVSLIGGAIVYRLTS